MGGEGGIPPEVGIFYPWVSEVHWSQISRQKVGHGLVVYGMARFQALLFTSHGLKFPAKSLFCWLEAEILSNFRP